MGQAVGLPTLHRSINLLQTGPLTSDQTKILVSKSPSTSETIKKKNKSVNIGFFLSLPPLFYHSNHPRTFKYCSNTFLNGNNFGYMAKEPVRIFLSSATSRRRKNTLREAKGYLNLGSCHLRKLLTQNGSCLNFNAQLSGVPYKPQDLSAGASHTPHPKRHQSLPEHLCQQSWRQLSRLEKRCHGEFWLHIT